MRNCLASLIVLLCCGAAWAQNAAPTLTFATPEKPKDGKPPPPPPKWTAKAGAGLVYNSGNSNSFGVDGNGTAGYNDGKNKVGLEVDGAYVSSTVVTIPMTAPPIIDQNTYNSYKSNIESTRLWIVKLRYDRFFTANNSAYLLGDIGGNAPAGKQLFADAQVGYRRQFVKSPHHDFSGDLGLDYEYENLVAPSTPDLNIGSLAVNLRYGLKFNDSVGLSLEADLLMNLNPETVPSYIFTPLTAIPAMPPPLPASSNVTPFQDTRLRGVAMIDAKLWKNLGFNFSFTAIFDNVPSPLPPIGGVNIYLPAQKLDTITSAKLTMTFL